MADALIIQIAEDVTELLNAGSFSQTFTAERLYAPSWELKELKTLRVSVVAKGKAIVPVTRQSNTVDYQIDVAIQWRKSSIADLDACMLLAEEIEDYFDRKSLPQVPSARWIGTERTPIWAPEHLREMRIFTTVITLTYRAIRKVA